MASVLEADYLKFYRDDTLMTDSNLSSTGQIGGLSATPAGPSYAVSKQYLDDAIK